MFFQNTFQNEEVPAHTLLSCHTYTDGPDGKVARHCHSYYEISYIIRGKRYEILNDKRYEVGDFSLFFIPPLAVHGLNNITDVEDVVIQFDHQFLRNSSSLFNNRYMLRAASGQGDYFQLEPSDEICRILDSIRRLCHIRDSFSDKNNDFPDEKIYISFNINSLCLQLISLMLRDGMLAIDVNSAAYSDIITLNSLINEILAHPEKKISMQEASRTVGMSYSHFSRFFEKLTGLNYTVFHNLLRIRQAEELLLTTSMPVSEVAAAIGIDTLSYFTRLFKQINGIPPIAYRKKYNADKDVLHL
ncbi:MAG TPA: AraC family transcriptional regulator [Clostridia bacterium]